MPIASDDSPIPVTPHVEQTTFSRTIWKGGCA
jgi:hypothetical protein